VNVNALLNLADGRRRAGRHEEALALLERALQADPASTRGWRLRGMQELVLGRPADAERSLMSALALQPDDARVLLNLGYARELQGRPAEAVADYERALALDPNSALTWVNLSNVHNRLGHFEGATESVRRALALEPDDAGMHNNLAWRLATWSDATLRRPAEAVPHARRAVELAPAQGDYWNTLGVVLHAAGDDVGAVAALERSTELRGGGDANDWLVLGLACLRLGRVEEARAWYERSLEWLDDQPATSASLKAWRAELELGLDDSARR
jgi:Tfp pilus assembly protein PilF